MLAGLLAMDLLFLHPDQDNVADASYFPTINEMIKLIHSTYLSFSNMASEVLFWALILIISVVFIQKYYQKQKKKLPPSPPALPILGHLHILKPPTHRTLQQLSSKYGPIIFLHLGNRPTLVVSSPSIVEECFAKNDVTFANRPHSHAAKIIGYNYKTIGFAPYGELWRNLRRFSTIEAFSSARLNYFSAFRTEEVRFIAKKLFSSCNGSRTVNLKSLFLELAFNVMMKMVSGKQWSLPTYMFSAELPTDSSEYIPILKWFGLGKKYGKMVENCHRKYDEFLQDLIDESRRNEGGSGSSSPNQRKTIIQSLLSLQQDEPEFYTEEIIKSTIQVLFSAGTNTSAETMEWAMSLLLNHPEELEKVKNEIDQHVTPGRLLEDSDLPKLPYLHCIIKETLRLFPAAPLLLPHFSSENCTISGFDIPRGTTLLVNAWAIHRDPSLWEEPDKFKPERFEGIKEESQGYKFLPFGMGRRSCPGAGMAMRLISLALGTLIHCFEWERIGPELVDFDAKSGLTAPKAQSLEALYRPRPSMNSLLSQL